MKRQIRSNVFETNSSSVHSLTICTKEEYEKWKKGELVYGKWTDKLFPITDEIKKEMDEEGKYSEFLTYEQFGDYEYMDQDTFEECYTTQNGDDIVVFGYYGYDN